MLGTAPPHVTARCCSLCFTGPSAARSARKYIVQPSAKSTSGPGGSFALHIGQAVPTFDSRSCFKQPQHIAWLHGSLTGCSNSSKHTGHSLSRSSLVSVTATGCFCVAAAHSCLCPAFQCRLWLQTTPKAINSHSHDGALFHLPLTVTIHHQPTATAPLVC